MNITSRTAAVTICAGQVFCKIDKQGITAHTRRRYLDGGDLHDVVYDMFLSLDMAEGLLAELPDLIEALKLRQ